jgi:lipopolysaccharide biosynthesis glycosyltransferase
MLDCNTINENIYQALDELNISNEAESKEVVDPKELPCAFVSLVMKNPSYVVGAMVMAHSLRMSQTKHKLVCMLTIDLYDKWRGVLAELYDEVVLTPYIKYKSGKLFSRKQNKIYDWKDISYTKWYCLALSQYRKICFLDADLVIVKNIDHLLELPAPAGCFVNPWALESNNRIHTQYYTGIKYGEKIPDANIQKALIDGFVAVGHCIVLEPSDKLYANYIKYMDTTQDRKFGSYCLSMVDEQSITHYMSKTSTWTQMGYEYNTIPWHIKKTNMYRGLFSIPHILHYFNKIKPWSMKRKEWPDLEVWWQYFDSMTDRINHNFELVQKNNDTPSTECPYCLMIRDSVGKSLNINTTNIIHYIPNHAMIAEKMVICPNLL